jgi:uncharacterized protein YciI
VKYVLFYESAAGAMEQAPLHFAAHKEHFDDFHARGTLLMLGPFGNWYVREWHEAGRCS